MAKKALPENIIRFIFFDDRKGLTKYLRKGNNGKLHPSEKKEVIPVCTKSGDRYVLFK